MEHLSRPLGALLSSHHDRICGKNTQSTLQLFSPDEYAAQYSGVCGGEGGGGPKWATVILSKQSSALSNEQALGS